MSKICVLILLQFQDKMAHLFLTTKEYLSFPVGLQKLHEN